MNSFSAITDSSFSLQVQPPQTLHWDLSVALVCSSLVSQGDFGIKKPTKPKKQKITPWNKEPRPQQAFPPCLCCGDGGMADGGAWECPAGAGHCPHLGTCRDLCAGGTGAPVPLLQVCDSSVTPQTDPRHKLSPPRLARGSGQGELSARGLWDLWGFYYRT